METLLEKAKKIKIDSRHEISNDKIELAISWAKGEVRPVQVAKVLFPERKKVSVGNVNHFLAMYLKEAIKKGYLVETKK